MASSGYQKFKTKIDDLESKFDDDNLGDIKGLEEQYRDLEENLYDEAGNMSVNEKDKLSIQLNRIKRENDLYDEDATLNTMFPNRHDDDFDEDSMSYDSIFGGD